ncbi:hypothetical protein FB45DRAFT_1131840 [Roridomyces roridus]|uniref:LIM zinc-binding domain-containing protein n=1 Tax=Roridomyces roridus TaxID=1738132 RepID=A0AAD7FUK3_9AGAR|nr:hypothetical protein FB45DRAFT_1131840 [Roridomyces roridus]
MSHDRLLVQVVSVPDPEWRFAEGVATSSPVSAANVEASLLVSALSSASGLLLIAAAPVVPWNQTNPKEKRQDRWSKTYVSKDTPESPTRPPPTSTSPTKRFPRPLSQSSAPAAPLANRVIEHITSSTSTSGAIRPPSPLKYSALAAESGILPSPHDTTLSKVYGSVLQPRDSLPVQACAHCATPFSPSESTIYPDPNGATSVGPPRFFCRSCFIANGGSRGNCASCARPVLILKSEGGFIHTADQYWHKRCFNCLGCDENIGDAPMVDLLGRPSCPDCFDTCLERDSTPKKSRQSVDKGSRSREGSPALEELEQRLGIVRTREASPALEELSHRLSMIGKESPTRSPRPSAMSASPSRYSTSREGSPLVPRQRTKSDPNRFKSPEPEDRYGSPSPGLTEDAIEEMKRRFMKGSSSSPSTSLPSTPPLKPRLRSSRSSGRLSSPALPDLTSDSSDATSSSAGPDSPPRESGSLYDVDVFSASKVYASGYGSRYTRETSSVKTRATPTKSPIPFSPKTSTTSRPTTPKSPSQKSTPPTTCVKCKRSLFSVEEGGRYVTVPDDVTGEPRTYHTDCFTCVTCHLPFKEGATGQAVFVKGNGGPCHVECAPVQKVAAPKPSVLPSIFSRAAAPPPLLTRPPSAPPSSSRRDFERAPLTAPATSTPTIFPRFGGSNNSCPGCRKSVSLMERGVVPGPQGSRWHATCLVCGGKKEAPKTWIVREERKKGEPGCGKKLDSAAKMDEEGGVWCRECTLLLPQGSPTRAALLPSHTGSSVKVAPQLTGTTTLARQITGGAGHGESGVFRQLTGGMRSPSPTKGLMGYGADPAIFRQLTGGGLSPTRTRSTSPTKGLGGAGFGAGVPGMRPRPKSVVGIRNTNIVRQMTGSSGL